MPLFESRLTPPWVAPKPPDDEDNPLGNDATELETRWLRKPPTCSLPGTVAQRKSEQALMKMGIRVEHVRSGFRTQPSARRLAAARGGASPAATTARRARRRPAR